MKNSQILKRFAKNVRNLRKEKGWSQEELAKQADLHRTYIGSIERNERNVSLMNVENIARALGVKARDLI